MVMGRHTEQPDTRKGKGSSISTAKLDYFSRISIDFPSYCWVKGQVLHYRARLLELVRLVATAESQIIYNCLSSQIFFPVFLFRFFSSASLSCHTHFFHFVMY